MENRNDYRNKCQQLVALLEQKQQELDRLKSQITTVSIGDSPALLAIAILQEILVTAGRNKMVCIKQNVTKKKVSCVEISYRNFLLLMQGTLQQFGVSGFLPNLKSILLDLNLISKGSFEDGGIPARVDGKTVRVVRLPEGVYDLLTESGGDRIGR